MVGSPIGSIYTPALNAWGWSFAHNLTLVQIESCLTRARAFGRPCPFEDPLPFWRKTMLIDGQCHCGRVTYEAEIDPDQVSICHCTDCQSLTGSPYRVTVICSADQVRMTGSPAKIYSKTGDNGRPRFQHFCAEC